MNLNFDIFFLRNAERPTKADRYPQNVEKHSRERKGSTEIGGASPGNRASMETLAMASSVDEGRRNHQREKREVELEED